MNLQSNHVSTHFQVLSINYAIALSRKRHEPPNLQTNLHELMNRWIPSMLLSSYVNYLFSLADRVCVFTVCVYLRSRIDAVKKVQIAGGAFTCEEEKKDTNLLTKHTSTSSSSLSTEYSRKWANNWNRITMLLSVLNAACDVCHHEAKRQICTKE